MKKKLIFLIIGILSILSLSSCDSFIYAGADYYPYRGVYIGTPPPPPPHYHPAPAHRGPVHNPGRR
jgi:hypothetical protein